LSLRREGLSALIVETQSGAHGVPALVIGEEAESDLRTLSDYRLYTWHVPDFFGDHRIAIAAIPPMVKQDRKSPVLVRELEWYPPNSTSPPTVNPEFELYAGLETGRPTLVPLQVHLYAETPAWQAYISHLDELWKRVFDPPAPDRDFASRSVVTGEKCENYELLRELCDLHANTSLDYSLIVQVDEFWHHRDAFRSQVDYLNRPESAAGTTRDPATRRSSFETLPADSPDLPSDRIPFIWDSVFSRSARDCGTKPRSTTPIISTANCRSSKTSEPRSGSSGRD
jgi:hypothetical protein